ncbi:MAG TPA: rhodanese-like domain-containing protein [Thermoanaerobaculia bacterium]
MRRLAVLGIFAAFALTASAQKVMIPSQTSNPNVVLTPAQPQQNVDMNLDKARRISRDEAMKLVKEHKAVLVDVRGKEAYDAGHIKGAVSMPWNEIVSRVKELPPRKMIVTYCA